MLMQKISIKPQTKSNHLKPPLLLTIENLEQADEFIIKILQRKNFKLELKVLENIQNLNENQIQEIMNKSKLKFLNPFV